MCRDPEMNASGPPPHLASRRISCSAGIESPRMCEERSPLGATGSDRKHASAIMLGYAMTKTAATVKGGAGDPEMSDEVTAGRIDENGRHVAAPQE